MSAYNGFSNFLNSQATSAASNSENSSGCSSPPSFRLAENQLPFPDNSQQPSGLPDDIDLGDEDALDGCPQSLSSDSKPHPPGFHPYARNDPKFPGGQGSKLKATTAERRATHNAIERARRESLNGRFLELARALPTMHNVKRPSKSVIVNKSLEWICESQRREYDLLRENAFLRNHVNELRAQLQLEPLPSNQFLIQPSSQLRYKVPSFSPAGVSPLDSNRNNVLPSGPYSLQTSRQDLSAAQKSTHGFVPVRNHQPLVAHSAPEGHVSPTQVGVSRQPTAGPFPVAHPQDPRNYLSPSLINPLDGCDKPAEEVKGPNVPSSGSFPNEDRISSIYLPGLSIHTDSGGSPFQSLSEPEAPTSTTGSSPSRMRYFSCSGSSDASENSPSRFDYSNVAAQLEQPDQKPLSETSAEQLNLSGGSKVEMLSGSVGSANRVVPSDVPLPIEPLSIASRPTNLDTHSSSIGCPSANSIQFSPSSYVGALTGSQDGFVVNSTTLPQVPRDGLINGPSIDSSMLTMPPSVNQRDGSELTTNGFQIGNAWVWG